MRNRNIVLGVLSALPIAIISVAIGVIVFIQASIPPYRFTSAEASNNTPAAISDQASVSSGKYSYKESSQSLIQKTEQGRLMLITHTADKHHFLEAYASAEIPALNSPRSGWTIKEVGKDAMWIPGACATKPSYILPDGQLMIDDASYDGINSYHYYSLYDPNKRTFRTFGGTSDGDQHQQERVMFINVEAGKLVFYIDHHDTSGLYATSQSYKHAKDSTDNYITRRVINSPELTYTDHRITYALPGFDAYQLDVQIGAKSLRLVAAAPGKLQLKTGALNGTATISLVATSSQALATDKGTQYNQRDTSAAVYSALGVPEYAIVNGQQRIFTGLHTVGLIDYFLYNGAPAVLSGSTATPAYNSDDQELQSTFVLGEY